MISRCIGKIFQLNTSGNMALLRMMTKALSVNVLTRARSLLSWRHFKEIFALGYTIFLIHLSALKTTMFILPVFCWYSVAGVSRSSSRWWISHSNRCTLRECWEQHLYNPGSASCLTIYSHTINLNNFTDHLLDYITTTRGLVEINFEQISTYSSILQCR